MHLFSRHNNSLVGKLKELNNQAMKVLVNKAFKSYYLKGSA